MMRGQDSSVHPNNNSNRDLFVLVLYPTREYQEGHHLAGNGMNGDRLLGQASNEERGWKRGGKIIGVEGVWKRGMMDETCWINGFWPQT